jgi:hypothetical protein
MHVLLALRVDAGSPMQATPAPPFDPWLVKSMIAAVLAMALAAVVIFFPTSRLTWVLMVGAIVFVGMLFYHPAHWHRRMAASMLAAAVSLSILPMLKATGELKQIGWFSVIVDNSPWGAGFFILGAVATMVLEMKARHDQPNRQEAKEPPSSTNQATQPPAQPLPSGPGAHPAYTGVVDAVVFGHPWRARMLAGKAVDAKPFCLRHRVPLHPMPGGTDWRCPQEACGYYQYHPQLAFMATDKRKYLTAVYNLIEQRLCEGVGFTICPDDQSAHI